MPPNYSKKNLIALLLIAITIAMIFLLPWLFSSFNGKGDYYGLYIDKAAHDFNLTNTSGKQITLKNFSGNYVYLMFGFTHCQEVCPLQLGNLLAIKHLTGKRPVKFIFITLDPDRDTEQVLQQYFEVHGKDFVALRSDSFQSSQALAMKYNEYAYIIGQKNKNYEINHNGYIFLLSPEGILKLIYTSTQLNHPEILEDLKHLIKNT